MFGVGVAMNMKKHWKKKNHINNQYFIEKNIRKYIVMSEENIIQEFRLKNIGETRNSLTEEINQNELTSKKHQKVYRVLNYIEHFVILISTVSGCVSFSAFASSVDISIGIL